MDCDAGTTDIPTNAQHAQDMTLPNDAAERKRVLNILAQRRYRRRRRERQATLESLVNLSQSIDQASSTSQQDVEQSISDGSPDSHSITSHGVSSHDSDASNAFDNSTSHNTTASCTSITTTILNGERTTCPKINPHFADKTPDVAVDAFWNLDPQITSLDSFLQTDEVTNATFADDFNIAVPELDLLRAAYDNASRVNSSHLLFAGLTAQSIFHSTDCSNWILTLPENLMPTDTQLTVPHHPAIDILPWPAVRNRLIKVYNMPPDLWPRHPSDGSESSLVRFIYDMEDGGIRVTGQDPAKESAWEIDQRFFENWWWALDQAIVANTNLKRLARGQRMLCAPSHGG